VLNKRWRTRKSGILLTKTRFSPSLGVLTKNLPEHKSAMVLTKTVTGLPATRFPDGKLQSTSVLTKTRGSKRRVVLTKTAPHQRVVTMPHLSRNLIFGQRLAKQSI